MNEREGFLMPEILIMKRPWIAAIVFCVFLAGSLTEGFCSADTWEKIDTIEGVTLFRSLQKSETLLPFKAVATLNVPYQKIVMALVDAEHKKRWAPKLKYVTLHNKISTSSFQYSEYYTTPWPFYDREFLLLGQVEYKKDRVLFSARNSPDKTLADKKHLLANVKVMEFAIIPLSPDTTRVEFTFSGDLGGWIPDFVKNIIQKKWPVRFIQAMQSYIQKTPNLETPRYLSLQKTELEIPQGLRNPQAVDRIPAVKKSGG
ncbi:MAG: START domain-containing protein [Desulforhopalus sp.]|nr:START domain-containing protein [Desulforhopalus sp.]